jgi:outer membrane protein
MKKTLIILSVLILVASYNSHAQKDDQLIMEFDYNVSLPMGQFKDFISKTGTRGFEFEMKYMLNDHIALGGNLTWYGFTEDFDRDTYYFDGGAITTQIWNYLTVFPIRAVFTYYFLPDGDVNPYVGIMSGAYYVDKESDVGSHNYQDKSWHFGLTPKVGCYFPMGGQTEWGFNFNIKYDYILYNKTTLRNEEWNSLTFFDFSLGVMVFF